VSFLFDFFLFSWGSVDLSLGFVFDYVSLGFFCSVSFVWCFFILFFT
jgi:hypothetical protein